MTSRENRRKRIELDRDKLGFQKATAGGNCKPP